MTPRPTPGKISRTLTLLLRAERLIAARRLSVLRRQTVMMGLAGLFVAIAVVMVNVAAYQGLATVMPSGWAALFVALGNLVLAGALALFAGRLSDEHDLKSAIEMRDMAHEELERELDGLVDEIRGTARDLRVFARDPLGSLMPGLIGPLISALLALLTGKGAAEAPEDQSPAGPDGLDPAASPQPTPDDPDAPFPEDPSSPPQA